MCSPPMTPGGPAGASSSAPAVPVLPMMRTDDEPVRVRMPCRVSRVCR